MNRYCIALPLIALSLSVMAGAASAGPREDVVSASQRCAGIADDRRWLDCYYGAAQPMRARLGLPPAPVSQIALVPPADAYVPLPAPPPATASPPRGAFGVNTAAPSGPPPIPRHQGGLFAGLIGGGKPVVANLRMSSYDFDRQGRFTVTLVDGEVWQQLDGDETHANWHDPASRYVVSVYNGAMGTFNLVAGDSGTIFKVNRIK